MLTLTPAMRAQWRRDGYIIFPGAVPRERVDAAMRAINHSLGRGIDPEQLARFTSQSFCPELQDRPELVELVAGAPVWPLIASFFPPDMVSAPERAQIALRFPAPADATVHPPRPHVDGYPSPHNGVPAGTIGSFTALVGVLLSDLPEGDSGNFTVWPGTHQLFADYFKDHSPEQVYRDANTGVLKGGVPPIPLPEPVQITGKAGDVVLAHYQLAHSAAGNYAPHTRYALFFRLRHRDHDLHRWEAMKNPWTAWAE